MRVNVKDSLTSEPDVRFSREFAEISACASRLRVQVPGRNWPVTGSVANLAIDCVIENGLLKGVSNPPENMSSETACGDSLGMTQLSVAVTVFKNAKFEEIWPLMSSR